MNIQTITTTSTQLELSLEETQQLLQLLQILQSTRYLPEETYKFSAELEKLLQTPLKTQSRGPAEEDLDLSLKDKHSPNKEKIQQQEHQLGNGYKVISNPYQFYLDRDKKTFTLNESLLDKKG